MEAPRSIVYSAIALSVVAIGLSGYAVLGRGPAGAPPAADSCADLRREVADLKKAMEGRSDSPDVRGLAARVAALEGSRAGGAAAGELADGQDDMEGRPDASARPAPSLPRYKSFDLPSKALSIRQDANGAISVSNTDPQLAGKDLLINARGEDGSVHQVHIVVPEPGQ